MSHVMCGYSAGDKLGLDSLQTCNERFSLVISSMFDTKVGAKHNLGSPFLYKKQQAGSSPKKFIDLRGRVVFTSHLTHS